MFQKLRDYISDLFFDENHEFRPKKKILIISMFITLFISLGFMNIANENNSFKFNFLILTVPLVYPIYQLISLVHSNPKRLLLFLKAVLLDLLYSIPVTIVVSMFAGFEPEHLIYFIGGIVYLSENFNFDFLHNDIVYLFFIILVFTFFRFFRMFQTKLKEKEGNIKETLLDLQLAIISYIIIKVFFTLIFYIAIVSVNDNGVAIRDLFNFIKTDALFLSLFLTLFFFLASSSAIVIIGRKDRVFSNAIFSLQFNAIILLVAFTVGFYNGVVTSFAKAAMIFMIIVHLIITKKTEDVDFKKGNKLHFIMLLVLASIFFIST